MTHRLFNPLIACAVGALVVVAPLRAAIPEQAAAAGEAFRTGHPLDALARYRTLLTDPAFLKQGSPELWYNRALAEEKTGDAPAATLSLRRSLLLDPGFLPAQQRLGVLLASLGVPFSKDWRQGVNSVVHPERLIIIGSVVGWIGVLLFVALLFQVPRKKGLLALALILLIAGHGASVFGSLIDPRRIAADQAVVTSGKAPTLRGTPADNGSPAGTVAPGSLISVLSRNGVWWYVAAGPGQTGWIPSDTVTPLLPTVAPSVSAKGF